MELCKGANGQKKVWELNVLICWVDLSIGTQKVNLFSMKLVNWTKTMLPAHHMSKQLFKQYKDHLSLVAFFWISLLTTAELYKKRQQKVYIKMKPLPFMSYL